jgi:hypothetical protein
MMQVHGSGIRFARRSLNLSAADRFFVHADFLGFSRRDFDLFKARKT